METPFPRYKKGVPRAGLDDVGQWIAALMISAIPFQLSSMIMVNFKFATLVNAAVGYATFKWVAVPLMRYINHRLPPQFLQNFVTTVFYKGGLRALPDPDPIPFKV